MEDDGGGGGEPHLIRVHSLLMGTWHDPQKTLRCKPRGHLIRGGEKGRKCYLSDKRQEPGRNGPYHL